MQTLIQDFRYALRMLAKRPGFSSVTILMLALGIGANTAIFGVLERAVRYQASTFKDFDRLYIVMLHSLKAVSPAGTYSDYVHLRDQVGVFEGLAAHTPVGFVLSGREKSERVYGQHSSINLFSMMGIVPELGRDFISADGEYVAILSHRFWRTRFGSDPSVLGRALTLNGKSYTVVGVLPADNQFLAGTQIFTPFSEEYKRVSQPLVEVNAIDMIGKVRSGVPFDQVRADIDSYTRHLEQELNLALGSLFIFMWHPFEGMSKTTKEVFLMLQCAVGLVLLLACANVANMLAARAMERQREMATRLALGAGRLRLMRQLLVEGLLLTMLATVFGLLLAVWGKQLLVKVLLQHYPDIMNYLDSGVLFNSRVLGFTVLVSILSGILFSLVPALRASQVDLNQALKEGSVTAAGFSRFEGRSVMVMFQIALALGVLIGASLLMKARSQVHGTYTGEDAQKVLLLTLSLNKDRYTEEAAMKAFGESLLERVAAIPGVQSFGFTDGHMPYTDGSGQATDYSIQGLPPAWLITQQSRCAVISPGYLDALQIPLRAGRYFTYQDVREGNPVVIINEGLIRMAKATQIDPIGKGLKVTYRYFQGEKIFEKTQLCTIIGVTADVKRINLLIDPWAETVDGTPEIFVLYSQNPQPIHPPYYSLDLLVRSTSNPLKLVTALRNAIWSVDKETAISDVQTMELRNAATLAHVRIFTALMGVFGGVSLFLAIVGVYAVMAQFVSQRTRELGIRMALGAQRSNVLWLVSRQGLKLIFVGVGIGLVVAYYLSHLLSGYIFGISPTDLSAFLVAPLVLIAASLLACHIPARRAAKVDPIAALRHE